MIDLEKMLAPISEESPTGVNLREDPADTTFADLEEMRTEVSPDEDAGGVGRSANWGGAITRCQEALAGSSKDLELAVWLTEGLARTEGFGGLDAGLRLITQLMQTFWDRLHPGFDEDEIILPIRARPLNWLGSSREFLRAAASAPIITGADGRQLSWDDYQNSKIVDDKAAVARTSADEMIEAGYISGEEWTARLGSASPTDLRAVLDHIVSAQEAFNELRALADQKFEAEAPNMVGLGELLYDVREYLEGRVGPAEEPGEAAPAEEGAVAAVGAAPGPAAATGPVSSRADALKRLGEVAEFFRRTEPHTPISYLIERAVRWGTMPLMEVLGEFIKDPQSLAVIQESLGIRSDESTPE
jgi:type VI secretion system protein ImpA